MQNPQAPISLQHTKAVKNDAGTSVFHQGFILRSVSKFVTGASEDQLMPIPIFYDPTTNKILSEGLPPELREELKDEIF